MSAHLPVLRRLMRLFGVQPVEDVPNVETEQDQAFNHQAEQVKTQLEVADHELRIRMLELQRDAVRRKPPPQDWMR